MNKVLSAIGRFFTTTWKSKGSRAWLLTTVIVMVVIFTVSMVATQVFWIRETISMVLSDSGERVLKAGDPDKYKYFESDYGSKAEVFDAANAFNTEIAREGFTLLKNDGNTLPLNVATEKEISVLGKNSVNLVYGGTGSGAKDVANAATIYSSLERSGFSVNQSLRNFYNSSDSGAGRGNNPAMGSMVWGFRTGETPMSSYTGGLAGYNIANYNKAAIVVISRIGGEGYDMPRTSFASSTMSPNKQVSEPSLIPGRDSGSEHYLELDKNEKDLIRAANASFSKVIVVVNSATSMELGDLNSSGDLSVDAILWIGMPGESGINALGEIISGKVNPSGRTVDTYARDFTADPTWRNFGDNSQTQNRANSNEYLASNRVTVNSATGENELDIFYNSQDASYKFVEYEEGIYVGYKYWETRGYTEWQTNSNWNWYEENVVYPLGYGMSYTAFDWEVVDDKTTSAANALTQNAEITLTVKVTNAGSRPGKDVVQVYVNAPYTNGGIEKSYVVLAGFAKTPMLYPTAGNAADAGFASNATDKPNSSEISITFKLRDIASYDFDDKNNNQFKGYEIESGRYNVFVSKNAHVRRVAAENIRTYTVSGDGFKYATTGKGAPITNLFQEESDYMANKPGKYASRSGAGAKLMSRSNFEGTFPVAPTIADRTGSDKFYESLATPINANFNSNGTGSVINELWADSKNPWYSATKPDQARNSTRPYGADVQLYELIGKDYKDPLWEELLNQLTLNEMSRLINTGNFQTQDILSIGKPRTTDPDGPVGFTNFMSGSATPTVYDTAFYVSECVVAATWNVDIAYEMGKMVGNEGLIGNERGDGSPYSGWYGPALNIHRSPFSGRNWEYYSEDGFLSGMMAANVVAGANSKGLYTYLKHFALNDQETHRDGSALLTWADEQTMREIYFRAFEIAVTGAPNRTEGGSRAMMSSFNRIGRVWAGGDYRLLTQLLRKEWGFNGVVVTDYIVSSFPFSPDQMLRAGGNLVLNQGMVPLKADNTSTQVSLMREAAKGILYTVVNSSAMNGTGEGIIWAYTMPVWVILVLVLNLLLLAGFAVWGFFAIRSAIKKDLIK